MRNLMPPGQQPDGDYSTAVADDLRGKAENLAPRVEALLFVAPAPVSTAQLAQALQVSAEDIDQALILLGSELTARGIRLQRHSGKIQFTTAPELAQDVETFLQLDAAARLSRAALEVLAIIAYRQPVTKPYVDSLRGVDSESSLTTLLRHGLIEESGRTEGPGRRSCTTHRLSALRCVWTASAARRRALRRPGRPRPERPLRDGCESARPVWPRPAGRDDLPAPAGP
jgi:segregation and condensation protein B